MKNLKNEISDTLKRIEHDIMVIENTKPYSPALDDLREIENELKRDLRRIDTVTSEITYVKSLAKNTERTLKEYNNA